jgi:protein-L-isoaspartate(D-aspartate) O-methyltransferase
MSFLPYSEQRRLLLERYIKPSGITDRKVLNAMMVIPRHEFIPLLYRTQSYEDHPLLIGNRQTISQPSLVALMTQELHLTGIENILEIGTGSGYQTAILSLLSKHVTSIERLRTLSSKAKKILEKLGYTNITIITADGSKGYSKNAPYDGVVVTAAAKIIPENLIDQMKESARIIIPIRINGNQELQSGIKKNGKLLMKTIANVSFVPMIS